MLVAVKMRKSQSCLLKKRDLCCNLLLDLMPADASENGTLDKFHARAGKPSGFIDQSRQDIGPQDSSFFHQRQMQANIQFRILVRQRDGIFECTPRHKQRGTRYDSILKRPQDPSVDSRRQSEVVRVNNQLFQCSETRAARISCRIFIRNATSSRIIFRITSGLARVEVPRFLGK